MTVPNRAVPMLEIDLENEERNQRKLTQALADTIKHRDDLNGPAREAQTTIAADLTKQLRDQDRRVAEANWFLQERRRQDDVRKAEIEAKAEKARAKSQERARLREHVKQDHPSHTGRGEASVSGMRRRFMEQDRER